MRRLKFICFLLITLVRVTTGQDSLFQQANRLYQDGDYEGALNSYREILQSGLESPDLYYNMGNSSYRSNNIGYAILYYEKALKLDPSHQDASHNLEFVSRYRLDTFEEVPELFIRTWASGFVQLLPERAWSLFAIGSYILVLCSILMYLFSRRLALKKTGFLIALLAILFFIISLSSAVSQHRSIVTPGEGIILSPSVVVKSSPSDTGTELFILHEGTRIKVNEKVSEWQNIRVIDGREGWIRSADFESI